LQIKNLAITGSTILHARWNKKQNIEHPSNQKYEGLPLQTLFKLVDKHHVCDHAGAPKKLKKMLIERQNAQEKQNLSRSNALLVYSF
jgi:hypothetical protein